MSFFLFRIYYELSSWLDLQLCAVFMCAWSQNILQNDFLDFGRALKFSEDLIKEVTSKEHQRRIEDFRSTRIVYVVYDPRPRIFQNALWILEGLSKVLGRSFEHLRRIED
jgi:hypothetical protein